MKRQHATVRARRAQILLDRAAPVLDDEQNVIAVEICDHGALRDRVAAPIAIAAQSNSP